MSTKPGHCAHCDVECTGGRADYFDDDGSWHAEDYHEHADGVVTWQHGHCPACRVADAIEAEELRLSRQCTCSDEWVTADHRAGMLRAAKVARGDA